MKDDVSLINEVLEKIPNKYMAMMVSSKRARELNVGIRPLVKVDAAKPTTIAMYEIASGFIVPGPAKPEPKPVIPESDKKSDLSKPRIDIDEEEDEDEEDMMGRLVVDDTMLEDTEEDDYE